MSHSTAPGNGPPLPSWRLYGGTGRRIRDDHQSREVVEAALAHKIRNQVEVAYRRTDLFEPRRRLIGDWAGYLAGEGRDLEVGWRR